MYGNEIIHENCMHSTSQRTNGVLEIARESFVVNLYRLYQCIHADFDKFWQTSISLARNRDIIVSNSRSIYSYKIF